MKTDKELISLFAAGKLSIGDFSGLLAEREMLIKMTAAAEAGFIKYLLENDDKCLTYSDVSAISNHYIKFLFDDPEINLVMDVVRSRFNLCQ